MSLTTVSSRIDSSGTPPNAALITYSSSSTATTPSLSSPVMFAPTQSRAHNISNFLDLRVVSQIILCAGVCGKCLLCPMSHSVAEPSTNIPSKETSQQQSVATQPSQTQYIASQSDSMDERATQAATPQTNSATTDQTQNGTQARMDEVGLCLFVSTILISSFPLPSSFAETFCVSIGRKEGGEGIFW